MENKLKAIDNFFENLSSSEFEQMAMDCGMLEINPLSHFCLEFGVD
jgi:hypothetical protein